MKVQNDPGMILIIGAGPTGLGAAYRLKQLALDDWLIIEAEGHAGGLASSFVDEMGFIWDVGGHVQFSHYDEYDRMAEAVLGSARLWHDRKSFVWFGDRAVPYPFQYNLHRLGQEERYRALSGLEEAALNAQRNLTPPSNYLEWIYRTFGSGIAELFMVPYNNKVWGYPLDMLDYQWIDDRVALPDLSRVRQSLDSNCDDVGWGPNRKFWYPLYGGTSQTWDRLAASFDQNRIKFGVAVNQVDLASHTVSVTDGQTLRWDTLITTLPLDIFCSLCQGIDSEIESAARCLIYNSSHIIGIGLRGIMPELLNGTSWIYFPADTSPYYRVTVLSNYSPHNAPTGCWSLLAEVTETTFRSLNCQDLAGDVTSSFRRDGLIRHDTEIVSVWQRYAKHGYPIPSCGRDAVLDRILPYLERNRVYSRGRFGAWKYEVSNQDHCFMQGVELVDRLLGIGEETTFSAPHVVNRQR